MSLHVDSEDRFSQDDGPEVEDGELVDSRGADTVSSQAGGPNNTVFISIIATRISATKPPIKILCTLFTLQILPSETPEMSKSKSYVAKTGCF